jgi:hypothetical protein
MLLEWPSTRLCWNSNKESYESVRVIDLSESIIVESWTIDVSREYVRGEDVGVFDGSLQRIMMTWESDGH